MRPRSLAVLALLLFASWRPSAATAQLPPSTQHYRIEAGLDPTRHVVSGTLELRFTNHASAPLTELLFHLYLNAFRDAHSVFMRESRGHLRGVRAQGSGSIELESLRIDGMERLPDARTELVPGDRTQLAVALDRPLAPGASIELQIRFASRLPKLFARSGYAGDFFAVAQWFPKLAKLEADGRFAGFPYHGLGEFYADFADYDVTLRVPEAFQVGAVGALINERREQRTKILQYRARHVHDMAWFASPDMVLSKRKLAGLEVIFLTPPDYALAQREHEVLIARGLAHFGRRFGVYPYARLTVVVPPRGAEGAAGMEYPSLIVTGGDWLPLARAPSLSGAAVSAHELAHQWFYGVIASHEVEHPVLDEGLSEWATLDLLRTVYGEREPLGVGFGLERFEVARMLVLSYFGSLSPGLPAPAYDARSYATSVYGAGFAARVLDPLLFAGQRGAVRILEASTRREGETQQTSVRAVREGAAPLPTWLAAYDDAGKELKRVPWPSRDVALDARFATSAPVARLALDPDRALLLDANTRDQIWLFQRPRSAPLLPRLIALAQQLARWIGP